MQKRNLLSAAFALFTFCLAHAQAAQPVVEVYKSAYCGCCEGWVAHLRANGFTVEAHDVPDPAAYRARFGIPQELGSCHSAKVGDYALEGHVPARDIARLLAEQPKARGLAVPGMPLGSPGMEADRAEAFDVMLIQADGKHTVYQHHAANASAQIAAAPTAMSDGEVRKIDAGRGLVSIKHGPLANLGMPPMTMTFELASAELAHDVKPGDKVRFVAEKSGNGYRVTRLEAAR
jgi:hypothetical protein